MDPIVTCLVSTFAGTIVAMTALWLVSLRLRDVGIVDVFWGTGFVLVAWAAVLLDGRFEPRDLLLAGMTTLWGIRLSIHILRRNWGEEEDRRYAAMREHHGPRFWWISLPMIFQLQAGLLWFVSMPLQIGIVLGDSLDLGWLDGVGVAIWAVGLFFEAVGDRQLASFKADPSNEGKVLDSGLWRYTRHPNYFGDFCVWWGLYLVAAAGGAWWTLASPLVMSVLLMRVSGVTLLESTISQRRPEYREYVRRTNAFFPGPRRAG